MDVNNLSRGEQIAGASGVLLLVDLFIFKWFGYGLGSLSGWDSMNLIRFIVLLAGVAGITLAVTKANQSETSLPVALSSLAAGLGILAVVLIVFRIISPPDFGIGDVSAAFGGDAPSVGRKIGAFIGLAAAAGVAFGGWTAMQEEGTSFGDQADRLQGGGDPPPPPPPPPPAQ